MPAGSGITLRASAEADIPTPGSGQATIFQDSDLSPAQPAVKLDDASVMALKGDTGAAAPPISYHDYGNTGASVAIDADAYNVQGHTLNDDPVAYTLSTTSPDVALVEIVWTQDGSGSRTLDHPGNVDFGDEGPPTLPTTAGAVYPINYQTVDGGANWIGITPMRAGPAGADGTNGADGLDGAVGGAIAIPYVFSTTTTDSDPGNGNLRLSNATQTSATVIRADLLASDTTDWSAVLATLADSTNTVKGHIRLFKTADPTKWLVFSVSALASPSGYKNITVANIAGSSSSPFSNGDAITLTFTRAGDVGASGTASVATDPIWDAAGDLAVGTGADTAAKLAMGSALQQIRVNAGATALEYFSPAISYVSADCSADQGMSADTQTDAPGCSISLAAGTWIIFGYMAIAIAASSYIQCLIADSSNTIYGVGQSGNNAAATIEASAHAVVTPGSTTTYKLRGQSGNGTIKKNDGTASHVLTRITAIRLA